MLLCSYYILLYYIAVMKNLQVSKYFFNRIRFEIVLSQSIIAKNYFLIWSWFKVMKMFLEF